MGIFPQHVCLESRRTQLHPVLEHRRPGGALGAEAGAGCRRREARRHLRQVPAVRERERNRQEGVSCDERRPQQHFSIRPNIVS